VALLPEVKINQVPDFDKEILEPLKAEQVRKAEEARLAEEKILADIEAARVAAIPKPVAPVYFTPVSSGELVGSRGFAIGGNCVNQIPFGLRAPGNPISWPSTSGPYIGGAALWHSNHVGQITGFWSNGDIEIAHQGWYGPPQTRFPRSTFRGFR
jgi:hypothetical protein